MSAELVDAWRLAARHLAPDREDELTDRLVAVEAAFWTTTATHQRSATLADLLAAAADELQLDVAEALLEEAAVRHLDSWTPHVRHDPEARPDAAPRCGTGACASGSCPTPTGPVPFLERFLARDGLAGLIDARLYTSEMPFQKPHPTAFRAALDALGVDDPSTAVFVGDRPWDDISGAAGIGMRTVLRPNPMVDEDGPPPDAVISALPELLALVDGWDADGRAQATVAVPRMP